MARLKSYAYAALTLGLTLAIGLIAWRGLDAVAAVLAVGGWSLALLGGYQIAPLLLAALSWRRLLGPGLDRGLVELTAISWIGLSVNWLLPATQIGGDLLRVRLLILSGSNGAVAGASIVVDKTIQAGIQILELEDASSWPRLVDNIRLVGSAVDAGLKAEELIASLESRRKALADSEHPPLRILPYSNFGAGGRTSGGRTTIDLIIQLAGHRNAASEAGLTGHPDLDLEQVLTLDPDAFLTSTGRDGVHPGSAFLRGEPVLEGLSALQTDAILELQAELYATASHRVIDAAEELAELVNEMR